MCNNLCTFGRCMYRVKISISEKKIHGVEAKSLGLLTSCINKVGVQISVVQRGLLGSTAFAGVRNKHLVGSRKDPLKISQLQLGCPCYPQM